MRYFFVLDGRELYRQPEEVGKSLFEVWRGDEWIPAVGVLFPSEQDWNQGEPISGEQAERLIAGEPWDTVRTKLPPNSGRFADAIPKDGPVMPEHGGMTPEQAHNEPDRRPPLRGDARRRGPGRDLGRSRGA